MGTESEGHLITLGDEVRGSQTDRLDLSLMKVVINRHPCH